MKPQTVHVTNTDAGITRRQALKDSPPQKTKRAARAAAPLVFPSSKMPKAGWGAPRNLRGTRFVHPYPHKASSLVVAGAYPWITESGAMFRGAYVGEDELSKGAFCYDPWDLYADDVLRSHSICLVGVKGTGKSMLAKALATRLAGLGRAVAVLYDPNGEWTKPAAWVGGSTVSVGPGTGHRINLFDVPAATVSQSAAEWAESAHQTRAAAVRSAAAILRRTTLMEDFEHTVIDEALRAVESRAAVVTFGALYAELEDPTDPGNAELFARADALRHTIRRMVRGDLAGHFDGESTVSFDVDAPMMTVDASSLKGASPEMKALTRLATSAWMTTATTGNNRRPRLVVHEEAAVALLNEVATSSAGLTEKVESNKVARHLGVSDLYLFHRFADLDTLGNAGTAEHARALALISGCDTKIAYSQDASDLPRTQDVLGWNNTLINLLPRLKKGHGIWQVGPDRVSKVHNKLTDVEFETFKTDSVAGERDGSDA